MIQRAFGIMLWPSREWKDIAQLTDKRLVKYLAYPAILTLIPAFAWHYGTTQIGWHVGDNLQKLTPESATRIGILFYITTLCCITFIGFIIHWMSATYGATSTLLRGVVISGFVATPILLAGAVGFVPNLAFDIVVAIAAAAYAVYLLYTGIPVAMQVPPERGFFYASAIVAVVLVMIVAVMTSTLILWEMGFAPEFTD